MRTPQLLAALILFSALGAIGTFASDITDAYVWKPMRIGGGGWMTGLNISPTAKGVMYARTDVSGAYRWNPANASWQQIVTTATMPAGSLTYGNYGGVDSLVSAPSDPTIAYMAFAGHPYGKADGEIYKSTDRGTTWKATGFRPHHVQMEPNGEGRQEGERLAIDPLDSKIVYYGSIENGLWVTRDGGGTWVKVDAIPAGAPEHGVNTLVFDRNAPSSKNSPGKTSVVFVTVDQGGIYRTIDAGTTWTKISDHDHGPSDASRPRDAGIGSDHAYYVACDNPKGAIGAIWKYSPAGIWTNITPPAPHGGSQSYAAVAVDPTDAHRVVAMINGGHCFVSSDGGTSWTYHEFRLTSPHIQWQGHQANYYLSVGQLAFDPFVSGKLWFAEGFGIWWADNLTAPDIEWHSASEGIEEMCGNDVIAPPNGQPVAAMWDLGAFWFGDVDAYTAQRSQPGFMSAWALDWCASDPSFLVGVIRSHLDFVPHAKSSGYSTDGGRTWTRFAALETGTLPADLDYGVIAVSANSPDNIVWSPAKEKLPYYTKDRGVTWKQSSFGGPTETGFNTFPMSQKPLCADRVHPGTFYFYRPQDGGLYRSTDGGANFAKVGSLVTNRWSCILKTTPGHAGDLWFAEGTVGGLWHSTDGGITWAAIPGLEQTYNVGLGKSRTPGGYPTVFAAGTKNGRTGIYRSTDSGKTWDQISAYPLGITDWIDALDGDKNIFGKVYIGFAGAGFAYGTPTASP